MVVRELKDGRCVVATQEDHAELSAQFAAHWGNERFSKLRPYRAMVFATTFHDSGYREWEGNPPINVAKGRPFAHREEIPSFEPVELKAYARNVEWVQSHDLYAGLLVSMHRTGLWQNRYNVFTEPSMRPRQRSAEIQHAKKDLEAKQEQLRKSLSDGRSDFEDELAYNYRALQIFDLLSLYFCCDGYAPDDRFKEFTIAPVRLAYGSSEEARLQILPGDGAVRLDPYPFGVSPLRVSVRARVLSPSPDKSVDTGLETYQKAERQILSFKIAQ